ncbi:FAD-dependent oxidoreductase [Paenibacillus sp. PvP091]|uniref:FAD-dependent oxidoreductase n=1 Tax=Paenibacillus sp. PvP091 TaxID=2806590 RepID=UPI001AE462A1|nr:FAD-dependent oxidoreductase [Paenibacillus sp. PvP091]
MLLRRKPKKRNLTVLLTVLALVAMAAVYTSLVDWNGKETGSPNVAATNGAVTPELKPNPESKEPTIPSEQTDIVIIGSELEGLYLARAAVDEGLKVKVLDTREAFGGQVLQGEMLFLDETRDDARRLLVQGRAKELFDGFRNGKIRKLGEFEQYFDKLIQGIPVEQGIRIDSVEQLPGQFGAHTVGALQYTTKDGQKKRIESSYWVENTDYAAMASKLEVNRLAGLEKFYGQNEIEYMSSGMMMKFKNVDWTKFQQHFKSLTIQERNKKYGYGQVDHSYAIGLTGITNRYQSTNDRVFLRGLNAVHQRDGEVIINAFLIYTVDPSDDQSVAEAMELGKKEIPLILDHFRSSIVGWENAELNGFPNYLYIREYNHYETDYVLKPSDMLGAKMFWDNVSIGGYPLDLQGTSANKWGIEMGRPDKYGMPLRSFLLKNYDNVIMAGKNVGASAIAFGSARIQPNTGLAAESIGVILGQIQGKKKLRELREADMPALQDYLASKYAIQLTGVTGNNKIAGWTAEEIAKLDTGEIVYAQYVKKRQ